MDVVGAIFWAMTVVILIAWWVALGTGLFFAARWVWGV